MHTYDLETHWRISLPTSDTAVHLLIEISGSLINIATPSTIHPPHPYAGQQPSASSGWWGRGYTLTRTHLNNTYIRIHTYILTHTYIHTYIRTHTLSSHLRASASSAVSRSTSACSVSADRAACASSCLYEGIMRVWGVYEPARGSRVYTWLCR